MYQPLDDRPGQCEGCNVKDYPSAAGPSAKQMTWNPLLSLWLCVDCQYSWSNWCSGVSSKPGFITMLEKASGTGQQRIS